MPSSAPAPLVGRSAERAALRRAVSALGGGRAGIVAIEGEPGIGKSRLLAELAAVAREAGCTVLAGRASPSEADLPFGLLAAALDEHLAGLGERRLATLGLTDPAALAGALPALGPAPDPAAAGDRHRAHRALRDLLERLAAARPLVLALDDVHWADPASLDALAALARRPPAAPVLLALATRPVAPPALVAVALAEAAREDRAAVLRPGPLSRADAEALVGPAAGRVYAAAGGNPFYLEELARAGAAQAPAAGGTGTSAAGAAGTGGAARTPRAGAAGTAGAAATGGAARTPGAGAAATGGAGAAPDGDVPPAVAAAVAAEVAQLPDAARRLLEAAAVAGDPFEAALAATVAELREPEALASLDVLLDRGLVRPAAAARHFAFRHPVVRQAVYAGAPGGWRLGAHGRAAAALERRGAGPVARAHHVEHAARPGDRAAVALLAAAARELRAPAPAAAARCLAGALRLLPDAAPARAERLQLQAEQADAEAAAGHPQAARELLREALRTAEPAERLALTVALANQEWWLGGHEDARRRLHVALSDLPAAPSPDRIRLRLALSLTALLACDLAGAAAQADDAREDARTLGDASFELAALAAGAVAAASALAADARQRLDLAAQAADAVTPEALATRLPALWMLARARRALGDPAGALADAERGLGLAARTRRERIALVLAVESVGPLVDLGRLGEAVARAEEGLERAALSDNPRMLLWAHCAAATALLAAGDVPAALRHATAAGQDGVAADVHAAGRPGWCLGTALAAAGNAARGAETFLAGCGGPGLTGVLPADRPAAAADLVEVLLAAGDVDAAAAALAAGEAAAERAGTPLAQALAGLARARVCLARGDHEAAVQVAAAAAAATEAVAPLVAATAALEHGRVLAAAGDRDEAREVLFGAQARFAAFGAERRRAEAVRELRRLGHRVARAAGAGAGALTAREQEIAELVASGRTTREVAEQLVLSPRTIEAHLRAIYGKLGVRSRVELTRQLARNA